MADFDWTRFTVRVPVNAASDELYRCWATRSGIEYWFLRLSEYKRPDGSERGLNEQVQQGDTYRWRWHGWPDEVEEHGVILDCNGKDYFKFSFGKAGICTVTVRKENNQALIELVQEQIPDDEKGRHYWHLGCKTGWVFYLTNLKSLLEGGIDLRNRDMKLGNVINS